MLKLALITTAILFFFVITEDLMVTKNLFFNNTFRFTVLSLIPVFMLILLLLFDFNFIKYILFALICLFVLIKDNKPDTNI